MKSYSNLLRTIIRDGVEKESGRANMPNTIGISKADISMDLSEGFPLLTTKKMFWKGIVHELLWFLRGETNIKYLVDNKVNIWNGDAYRWYLKYLNQCTDEVIAMTEEDFKDTILKSEDDDLVNWFGSECSYKLGDLGKVYGYQWRNQNGVDQVADVVDGLESNPYSRYHIIDGWNKADFVDMALPPCHLLYQFIVRPLSVQGREKFYIDKHNVDDDDYPFPNHTDEDVIKKLDEDGIPSFYLDTNMYQRSCDTFLGVPFNLASMSLLNLLISKACNMIPGVANWIGGDTHLYLSHLDSVKEQLSREPLSLPEMVIKKDINSLEDICNLTIDDFSLVGYESHPSIKAELFTGVKK